MKKIITIALLLWAFAAAASENTSLESANIDLTDNDSLLRGAKHFVTHCLGCHSIKHMRYLRIAKDLDVDEKVILRDIAPLGAGIYDPIHSAMNKHDAEKWFGTQPPDLSLIARSRGTDWLYTYLKSYYTDEKKPFGVNNMVFPDTAMPNPFWQLQGEQHKQIRKTIYGEHEELVLAEHGTLSEREFDALVSDLTNFLAYASEPVQLERERLGKYVLAFLIGFMAIAYMLKKEYWKDVH